MAKRNKNNKQKPLPKPAVPKPIHTQNDIDEANREMEEVIDTLQNVPIDEVNVQEIENSYVTDGTISPEDVAKCVAELKKNNKILIATQKAYEVLKETYKNAEKRAKEMIDKANENAEKIKKDAQTEAYTLTSEAQSKVDSLKEEITKKETNLITVSSS